MYNIGEMAVTVIPEQQTYKVTSLSLSDKIINTMPTSSLPL